MARWLMGGGLVAVLVGLTLGLVAVWPRAIDPEGTWDEVGSPVWRWLMIGSAGVMIVVGWLLRRAGIRRAHRTPDTFLTRDEEERVLAAIAAFERRTSGEIRVHLARRAGADILADARKTFEKLGMTETAARNGVLFFVGAAARRFAVIGDQGIDAVVPDGFWDEVVDHVGERLRKGERAGGLIEGIRLAGEALAEHFPIADDDVNELPDEISREE